jgi:hypothetical protein
VEDQVAAALFGGVDLLVAAFGQVTQMDLTFDNLSPKSQQTLTDFRRISNHSAGTHFLLREPL